MDRARHTRGRVNAEVVRLEGLSRATGTPVKHNTGVTGPGVWADSDSRDRITGYGSISQLIVTIHKSHRSQ